MAEYGTVRQAGAGVRTAQIDEGLRAHMNKVYGTMSVGMLITGARGLGGRRARRLDRADRLPDRRATST